MLKLALMLMLVGGEQQVSKNGSQTRAELHMLLVGDPGTGKLPARLLGNILIACVEANLCGNRVM